MQGLGISFLRHIERCLCLLYVIDIGADNPLHQLNALKYELSMYQENLPEKSHAIIVNKMDLEDAEENSRSFRQRSRHYKVMQQL